MIFAVEGHIEKIIAGTKTQTRRVGTKMYLIGHTYSIQPCRTCKGIIEGRILILNSLFETPCNQVNKHDSNAEGGYTPEEFEKLFEKMHPNWWCRIAYTFKFIPSEKSA